MFRPIRIATLMVGLLGPAAAVADWEVVPGYQPWPVPSQRPAEMTVGTKQICALIAKASEEYGVPRDFFARLIWKESRFDVRAISPVGAQGIAQFMPTTARIRGLKDPFDPRQAIPASAHFLADLKARLGSSSGL